MHLGKRLPASRTVKSLWPFKSTFFLGWFVFLSLSAQTYKAFLPAMIANNHGHLVSIASSAGLIGVNGLAGVCVFPLIISYHSYQEFRWLNALCIKFVCDCGIVQILLIVITWCLWKIFWFWWKCAVMVCLQFLVSRHTFSATLFMWCFFLRRLFFCQLNVLSV